MMLVEQTPVPTAALPVAQFKDHLRLGTGFADDGVQDDVLVAYLQAAIATIEARTGKALIARSYVWTLTAWRDLAAQPRPQVALSGPLLGLHTGNFFNRQRFDNQGTRGTRCAD